jgi:hypothetical protein
MTTPRFGMFTIQPSILHSPLKIVVADVFLGLLHHALCDAFWRLCFGRLLFAHTQSTLASQNCCMVGARRPSARATREQDSTDSANDCGAACAK